MTATNLPHAAGPRKRTGSGPTTPTAPLTHRERLCRRALNFSQARALTVADSLANDAYQVLNWFPQSQVAHMRRRYNAGATYCVDLSDLTCTCPAFQTARAMNAELRAEGLPGTQVCKHVDLLALIVGDPDLLARAIAPTPGTGSAAAVREAAGILEGANEAMREALHKPECWCGQFIDMPCPTHGQPEWAGSAGCSVWPKGGPVDGDTRRKGDWD